MTPAHSLFAPATPEAASLHGIALVLTVGAAAILLLVVVLAALALRRGPRPARAAVWVLGGGLAFPVVVLSALLGWSLERTLAFARPAPPDALEIHVGARMWWWELRYRDPAGGPDIVGANELRVPAGRPVRLVLESADVIHSLWFPSLHGKADLTPGRVGRLVFTVEAPGVHRGQCAEFCGLQHARMAIELVALAPREFDAWLARQAAPARVPADPRLAAGARAFADRGCAACHTVRGIAARGRLGPDLTHVASRRTLGAGVLPNGPGAAAKWVAEVQRLKPGARMPAFDELDAPTLAALGAWLESLE